MNKKQIKKIIATSLLAAVLTTGIGVTNLNSLITNNPNTAYAVTVPFNDSFNPNKYGTRTDMGWITGKLTLENNMPENATVEDLAKISVQINPEDNPEYFHYWTNPGSGDKILKINYAELRLTNNIYYWSYVNQYGEQTDEFVKVLQLKKAENINNGPIVTIVSASYLFSNGEGSYMTANYRTQDNKLFQMLRMEEEESNKPTEPEKPIEPSKTYTSERLSGLNRFSTATAIAKKYSSEKLDAVVIANAYNFPDALAGSTLAAQENAPILLVGKDVKDSTDTINYIKNNLKDNGTVYVLGGTGVISNAVISEINNLGFKNVKRLGGKDRFVTNMNIVNELDIQKGTDVVIAYSHNFADSLSISSIAGAKGMPIFLVNNTLSEEVTNKIKEIQPNNIYIVGGTGVVPTSIENQLKTYGKVTRLGGANRYDTSLAIAKKFTTDSTTVACIASGANFPDALAGSVLASKENAPILLVNQDVNSQKTYLDGSKINKIYTFGGTGVISDNLVNTLTKSK